MPDPEAQARAEEEARQREAAHAAAVKQAEDEYDASVQMTLAREARGRDIPAAYAALEGALAGSKDRILRRELFVAIPRRARTPIAAVDQAGCAAFHGALALSMETWANQSLPKRDATFIDAERSAHEAGTVFDRGESIAGCDALASAPIHSRGAGKTSNARADAASIASLVQALGPAAEAVRKARAEYERAQADGAKAKQAGELARARRATEDAARAKALVDLDDAVREAGADKKRIDAQIAQAKAAAWAIKKAAQHDKFLELLERQAAADRAEADAKARRQRVLDAAGPLIEKAKADEKEQAAREALLARQVEDLRKQVEAEQKEALEREARAADAVGDLEKQGQGKPRPARLYRASPRPTRYRGPRC